MPPATRIAGDFSASTGSAMEPSAGTTHATLSIASPYIAGLAAVPLAG